VPLTGEQPAFLQRVLAAVQAAGGGNINVISGYRSPAENAAVGGVPGSNHTRGLALDATVTLPGRGTIPLGQLQTLAQFGLRSGDQPGFYRGGRDPNHVDAGYMAQGVAPLPDPRSQPAGGGFFGQVLGQLGIRPTPASLGFLNAWAQREGVPQSVDPYNLLGTTLPVGGSYGTNAPGVQAYPSLQAGVTATARMLGQPNFSAVAQALASGNPEAYRGSPTLQAEMRSWSGGGYSWPTSGASLGTAAPGLPVAPAAAGPSVAGAAAPAPARQLPPAVLQALAILRA
jgi:hypothetical protein